jgi:hypothetical protein
MMRLAWDGGTVTGDVTKPASRRRAADERDRSTPKGKAMIEAIYQVRVAGPIPAELLTELDGLNITIEPAETVLYGSLPDQSALVGLITRIHGLGIRLIEVRRLVGSERVDVQSRP